MESNAATRSNGSSGPAGPVGRAPKTLDTRILSWRRAWTRRSLSLDPRLLLTFRDGQIRRPVRPLYDGAVRGRVIAESLRIGAMVELAGVELTSVSRHDVSTGTRPDGTVRAEDGAVVGQPPVWTFVDFGGSDDLADEVAGALAAALLDEGGWYADIDVGDDKIVVFADRVFRYAHGDSVSRDEAAAYGRRVGVPEHQLDWE